MDGLEGYSVTVTVPVYNSSGFIDDCLDNLFKQTYDIFEAIFVVDKRTTDDSEEKLRKRSVQYNNIRIIIQTDEKGLAGARNIGIEEARGDIIWFLDVDDFPHPDFLKEHRKKDMQEAVHELFWMWCEKYAATDEDFYS